MCKKGVVMLDKRIADKIDLYDRYVKALIDFLFEKQESEGILNVPDVQARADNLARNLVNAFLQEFEDELTNKETNVEVFRFMSSRGANKLHSGNRFSEQLYKTMLEQNTEKQNDEDQK